jgi:hypothetical protein
LLENQLEEIARNLAGLVSKFRNQFAEYKLSVPISGWLRRER